MSPVTTRRRRIALFALAGACAALASFVLWRDSGAAGRGQAMFSGDAPLSAHLHGHDAALPVLATRCINCHGGIDDGGAAARAAGNTGLRLTGKTAASKLDHDALTTARVRRGGPATRYDAKSLCTLLRSGVDPAGVMIPDAMPRYEASDAQCSALWAYFFSSRR